MEKPQSRAGVRGITRLVVGLLISLVYSSVPAGIPPPPPAPPPPVNFEGTGVGAIPDCVSGSPPLEISFKVSDYKFVSHISVIVGLTIIEHTWIGDLVVKLVAPNGAEHSVFGRVGLKAGSSLGDASDLDGNYSIGASLLTGSDLWTTAAGTLPDAVVPPGAYRSRETGDLSLAGNPPISDETIDFSSVTNPNGIWKLLISDHACGDKGTVSRAVISLGGIVPQEELCLPITAQNGNVAVICI